jgi:hypothetical protein
MMPLRTIHGWLPLLFALFTFATCHMSHADSSFAVKGPSARLASKTDSSMRPIHSVQFGSSLLAKLPLAFEPNLGQTNSSVRFLTHGPGYSLFLSGTSATFTAGHARSFTMQLIGANNAAVASGKSPLVGRVNYLSGNDARKWHTDIPTYGRAQFSQVYPGVDVAYYGRQGHLEYDFIVSPHADAAKIALAFHGAKSVRLLDKKLQVETANNNISWNPPMIYQTLPSGTRVPIAGGYILCKNASLQFEIGAYDHDLPLVIDPVLDYAQTFAPSEGYQANVSGIAVDTSGDIFLAGTTKDPAFYPVSNPPGYQSTDPAGATGNVSEAFVIKVDPVTSEIIYATYIGGLGQIPTYCNGIAVGRDGDASVTGYTSAPNFPVTASAFQTTNPNATAAFVTKLNTTGSSLVYSTYLGQAPNTSGISSASANAIAIDRSGKIYIGGTLTTFEFSAEPTTDLFDFPTTANAFQPVQPKLSTAEPEYTTGFLASFDPTKSGGASAPYISYVGGNGGRLPGLEGDSVNALTVDAADHVFLTGTTLSTNMPVTPNAVPSPDFEFGVPVGFVLKLDLAKLGSSELDYGTYLGGSGSLGLKGDLPASIAVSSDGLIGVTGITASPNFPTTANAHNNTITNPRGSAFVSIIDPSQPSNSLIYSTFLGSAIGPGDSGEGITFDTLGLVDITGEAQGQGFPITPGALATVTENDSSSVFLTRINPYLAGDASFVYSTFLDGDGAGGDIGQSLVRDLSDNFYIGGTTTSDDFAGSAPVAPNSSVTVFESTNSGNSFLPTTFAGNALGLFFDPENADTIFVASNYYFLIKTSNNGSTWHTNFPPIDILQTNGFEHVAVSPIDSSTVYANMFLKLYRSLDGGNTFTADTSFPSTESVSDVVYVNSSPPTLVATCDLLSATQSGVSISTDGTNWTQAAGLTNVNITAITNLPNTTTLIACGYIGNNFSSENIYESTNAGANWTYEGNCGQHTGNIAVDPNNLNDIFISCNGNEISASTDAGKTWRILSAFSENGISGLVFTSGTPSTLLMSTDSGIWKSTNEGLNWTQIGTFPVSALTVDPFNNVFATSLDIFTSAGSGFAAELTLPVPAGQPDVTSISPTSGIAGSLVTVRGLHLSGSTKVFFNSTAIAPSSVTSTSVTAIVPVGATSGPITLVTPTGRPVSAASFTITTPPTVTSFAPDNGPVGTVTAVSGHNFTGMTAASVDGYPAAFAFISDTTATITVPAGASTGSVHIKTPYGLGASTANFDVIKIPTITSFAPTSGAVGTVVAVSGHNFTGMTAASVDGYPAVFTFISDTTAIITVPAGASTGSVHIKTPFGLGASSANFVVIKIPTITSFAPASGAIGTTVTVTGTNFTGSTAVSVDGYPAAFTLTSDTSLTFTVPKGVGSGAIHIKNAEGLGASTTDFQVLTIPVVTSFSPTSGTVGTVVTVTGTNYTGATAVSLDGYPASFTPVSSTELTFTVPKSAGTGAIHIKNPQGLGASTQNFMVSP